MAVPTVTTISPAVGPVGGSRLVQIMGQGFQLPPVPPPTGPAPAPNPSVEVLFGTGAAAKAGARVAVASASRLFVVTPPTPLNYKTPAGAVDVTVRNIDQSGVLVPGETVTVADGYTYEAPNINSVPTADLTRLVRTLIRSLRRQILQGVYLTVHTDYADDPAAGLAALAEIPAIVLSGPDLRENRFYSLNDPRPTTNPFGLGAEFFAELRPPYTVDLVWDVIGVTDNKIQGVNLMAEVMRYFHRNKTIGMDCSATDPSQGSVSYEMDWEPGAQPKTVGVPNNSNIRAFKGTFAIRGFDIDEADMAVLVTRELEDQTAVGSVATPSAVVLQEPEQTGSTYQLGPSPGPPGDC